MNDRAEKFESFCQRMRGDGLRDDETFIKLFNSLLHDERQHIDIPTLSRWRDGAYIPNKHIGYLTTLFGINYQQRDQFQNTFSLEYYIAQNKAKLAEIFREPKRFKQGYFADLYSGLEGFFVDDRQAFSEQLGVYPAVLDACADGSAIPSKELVVKILSLFNLSGKVEEIAIARMEKDLIRLGANPREKKVAVTLGAVTHETNLRSLLTELFSDRELFHPAKLGKEIYGFSPPTAQKIIDGHLTGVWGAYTDNTIKLITVGFVPLESSAYRVFEDVGKLRKPVMSGDDIVANYVDSGGKRLSGLIDAIMQEKKFRTLFRLQ